MASVQGEICNIGLREKRGRRRNVTFYTREREESTMDMEKFKCSQELLGFLFRDGHVYFRQVPDRTEFFFLCFIAIQVEPIRVEDP